MGKVYKNICISLELKEKLQALKQHPKESYGDVIKRLLEKCKEAKI